VAQAIDPVQGGPGRRKGFGHISSIDRLPEQCDEDIEWANTELRERRMPQTVILEQFNARLADKGIKGISKSAFSRHSVRLAMEIRKMEASRRISDEILQRLAPGERSEGTIAATELLKHRILEMVLSQDEPDLGLLEKASLTIKRLSSTAIQEAEELRGDEQRRRDEEQRKANEETAAKVAFIATEAGLGEDRIAAIRKGVLGLN